jgi:hypothetical protein
MKCTFIFLTAILSVFSIGAQSYSDVLISPSYGQIFIGMENAIRIVAQQETPVSPDQVKAENPNQVTCSFSEIYAIVVRARSSHSTCRT